MSRSYGGFCKKESENEDFVTYLYSAFNRNDGKCHDERICGGKIIISKKAVLKELNVRRGGKLPLALFDLYRNDDIVVENLSDTPSEQADGMDIVSIQLCRKLLGSYEKEMLFPDRCNYEV